MGWIGVDLDGTLAKYTEWRGPLNIGPPVPRMLERVKEWLKNGTEVRIVTARVNSLDPKRAVITRRIRDWLRTHLGQVLPITSEKSHEMIELWDDRAVQVETNTGRRVDGKGD